MTKDDRWVSSELLNMNFAFSHCCCRPNRSIQMVKTKCVVITGYLIGDLRRARRLCILFHGFGESFPQSFISEYICQSMSLGLQRFSLFYGKEEETWFFSLLQNSTRALPSTVDTYIKLRCRRGPPRSSIQIESFRFLLEMWPRDQSVLVDFNYLVSKLVL